MAGVNPGGVSRSNIGITWGHRGMTLLAKKKKTYNFLPPGQEIDQLSQYDHFVIW